jgi:alanine racemase
LYTVNAYISKSALRHNLKVIKKLAAGSKIIAMVKAKAKAKANAYGHGSLEIAEILYDVDFFGVARLHEALALALRNSGVQQRIFLTEGFLEKDELYQIAENNLEIVVHHEWQLEMLNNIELKKPISVWLKVDTGMHRLGFSVDKIAGVLSFLSNCPQVKPIINFMTHLSSADEPDSAKTAEQISCFKSAVSNHKGFFSAANTAAIFNNPESHMDYVRPGIALYGANPLCSYKGTSNNYELKPVMSLFSKVIAIQELRTFESVGYNPIWKTDRPTKIAVVAIGYGDGYPRHAKGGTPVYIDGQYFPLVGRISMDMITIDIGDADIKITEKVELWGENLSINIVAAHAGTISYELLCSLTQRVKYHYV